MPNIKSMHSGTPLKFKENPKLAVPFQAVCVLNRLNYKISSKISMLLHHKIKTASRF